MKHSTQGEPTDSETRRHRTPADASRASAGSAHASPLDATADTNNAAQTERVHTEGTASQVPRLIVHNPSTVDDVASALSVQSGSPAPTPPNLDALVDALRELHTTRVTFVGLQEVSDELQRICEALWDEQITVELCHETSIPN